MTRADLDLVQLAAGPEHRGMERLVAVRLGARDVILDPFLYRRPLVVDRPEHVIALGDVVHEHAHGEQVVDLFERLAALLHLLVDGPEVLRPTRDLALGEAGGLQLLLERRLQPLDGPLPLDLLRPHLARQRAVIVGLEELEGEVLELGLHARHAEAVCQRRVDLARLERDATLLLVVQMLERPHVVESVGELDDDDAGVLRDREQQLAIVLRLLLGGGAEGEGRELGQPVHQLGDLGAEGAADVVERDVRVLDHVVQQRGRDGRRVHLLLGENRGDGDAVGHVVVPRLALLAAVGLGAHPIGAREQVEVEAVPLGRDGPGELGSEDGSGAGHNRRMASPWGRVNAGSERARPPGLTATPPPRSSRSDPRPRSRDRTPGGPAAGPRPRAAASPPGHPPRGWGRRSGGCARR